MPTIETCGSNDDEDCDGVDCVLWARIFGDAHRDEPTDIAVDAFGNTIVAGFFREGFTVNGEQSANMFGNYDRFVMKLDPEGKVLWWKDVAPGYLGGNMAVDPSGNVFVSDFFSGSFSFGQTTLTSKGMLDSYVLKLSKDGDPVWAIQLGVTGNTIPSAMRVDMVGDLMIAGQFDESVNLGGSDLVSSGKRDLFMAKIAGMTGKFAWGKSFGAAGEEVPQALAIDGLGNATLTGTFNETFDFGQAPLTDTNPVGWDVFIVHLDGVTGTPTWSDSYAVDAGAAIPTAVSHDSDGNIAMSGKLSGTVTWASVPVTTAGGADIFVVKLDPSGSYVWDRRYGSAAEESGRGATFTQDGSVLIVADGVGSVSFGGEALLGNGKNGVFVAALSGEGDHLWSRLYNNTTAGVGACVSAVGPGGTSIACLGGDVDFGTGELPKYADSYADVVVLRLAP